MLSWDATHAQTPGSSQLIRGERRPPRLREGSVMRRVMSQVVWRWKRESWCGTEAAMVVFAFGERQVVWRRVGWGGELQP